MKPLYLYGWFLQATFISLSHFISFYLFYSSNSNSNSTSTSNPSCVLLYFYIPVPVQHPFHLIAMSSSSKLKGPRPAPLMLGVDSHKLQKPVKKPVIIYMVAPEIIHVEAAEFMSLVQRLTGPNSPSSREIRKMTTAANNDLQISADKDKHHFPVKVKARTINRPASSSGMKLQQSSPQSPISPTLFFHDLSPISRGGGGALKEGAAASQGWLHHHADFLGNGLPSSGGGLGSPTFLDIFGPLPPQS